MADRISEDEIAMLMRAFNKHDTDGDGVISTAELAKVLHSLGQNPTDAELQGTTLSFKDSRTQIFFLFCLIVFLVVPRIANKVTQGLCV